MRVLFRSSFDRWTGYGNDAVDIAVTLEKLGADVVPVADGMQAGLPREFTRLLEKEPYGSYDAVLQFAPPFDIKPWRLFGSERRFGWTMWERTPMVDTDFDDDVRWEKHRWSGMKLMFVTCQMNVAALQAQDDRVPLTIAPCGVAEWPDFDRPIDRRMVFLMIGMLAGRKDPFLLLDVWRELKHEHPEFDAVLVLKTAAAGLHPQLEQMYPDVRLISKVWGPGEVAGLYANCDVLVSVSRGEGNNKPAMEFMASGGAVMASDWSAHRNWLHEDWAYPLSGEVVQSPGGWSDFRVDRDRLKERLLECWMDRETVKEKGRIARGVMLSDFSWEKRVEVVYRQMLLS